METLKKLLDEMNRTVEARRATVFRWTNTLDAYIQLQESAEPVAFGMPNSAITGKKMALMMVRLDIPSDDQYGGRFWVPLYAAPPPREPITREAFEAAARAVGALKTTGDERMCANFLRALGIEVKP